MKKIELPKEACWNEKENENFWFYDEFKNGSRKHWKISLYELAPVVSIKKIDDSGEEMDCGYSEYKMVFNDGSMKLEFSFRKYNDADFYMVYLNGDSIMDYIEDYDDLAGCCRSAMYYFCERV